MTRNDMSHYKEDFPVGSQVQVADSPNLNEFRSTWSYHHPLQAEQLEFAGCVATIESVSFYHGGDVLYQLLGVPGVWHERCLQAAP